jgi:ABC-type Mn2+/Zn2+ transport system ATPase subunit
MSAMVKAARLRLGYGRRRILEDVDLEMRSGDLWFLVGPNGSGKTTLVRAILREIRPSAGELLLDPELARKERIGYVPQHCELHPTLPTTVREFVSLGLAGMRAGRAEREEAVASALRKVALDGHEKRSYWALSGGQRQRALVARALARRPEFLIADEPTAGLDLAATESLIHALVALNQSEGLTVLFVTHDLELAFRHASHVALCNRGRLVSGPAAAVLTAENLESAFAVSVKVFREPTGAATLRIECPQGAS